MDIEIESTVHVTDEEGDIIEVTMSLRSILMDTDITTSGTPKPLFPMIAKSRNDKYEGILHTGKNVRRKL